MPEGKKRIVILGGGFGGIYTGMYLEKHQKKLPDWEIVIVNRENYFVYQPMLAEVVGGSLGLLDTVSHIHRLVPKAKLMNREIEGINLKEKQVILGPKFTHTAQTLRYDHLVLALGMVTDFRGAKGLHEHAFPFKNLADSLRIRNHLIDVMETASSIEDPELKKQLLTFVVGGGGFSGVEIVAELNDFVRMMAKKSRGISSKEIRVVLIQNKNLLMNGELSESLSRYAEKILKKRGVEIRFEQFLSAATPEEAILGNGERISSKTIISTVPSSPNPIIDALEVSKDRGKIKTDSTLLVEGSDHLWAIGDCARIPLSDGTYCPPTAQFAIREAKILAENIIATIKGGERKPFFFKSIGMLGALGHRCAVAELFGCIKLSGIVAWFMWRTLYWAKLPGLDRKIKVALSWMLDMFFPIEVVQLEIGTSHGMIKLHYESGEVIFNEGDIGDYLYIITEGVVEVIKNKNQVVAQLKKGDFFGESALLHQKARAATVRCIQPTDVLALRKSDFGALIENFKEMRDTFERKEKERK